MIANVPEKVQECFALLVDSVLALQRENKEVLWGSMVKETMKRKKPSFNETYYGFRTFSQLLEDAQRRGIVKLRRDQKSGSYIVEDLGTAANAPQVASSARDGSAPRAPGRRRARPEAAAAAAAEAEGEGNGPRTRPRRRRGRGRGDRPRPGARSLRRAAPNGPGRGVDGRWRRPPRRRRRGRGDFGRRRSPNGPAPRDDGAEPAHPDRGRAACARGCPRGPERTPFSLFWWMRRDRGEEGQASAREG